MKYLDIKELQLSVSRQNCVLYLECDILTLHTHSVLTNGSAFMIEVPLNVAKCLFFSNVLYEKLVGEEKALLMYLCILEGLYSTTF